MPPPCYCNLPWDIVYCNLPWDIVVEILSWLPAASLLRLRSVSKPLRDLIDSPGFANKHLLCSVKSNRDLKLIVAGIHKVFYIDLNELEDRNVNDFISIKYPFGISQANVLACCHGLICIWNYESDIILWNPSTMTYQTIPHIAPVYIFSGYGFCYDALNDDYKLVVMVPLGDYSVYYTEVHVYSLKSDYWRKIEQVIPYRVFDVIARIGVFVGSALHWTVFSDMNTLNIIAFDVGTEEYRELSKPNYEGLVNGESGSLDVLGGSLSFVCSYCASFLTYIIDVWVMKEYGVESSWTKLVSVSNLDFICGLRRSIRPLAYSKCGKEVLIQDGFVTLFWYDLEKNIKSYVKLDSKIDCCVSYACFDNLVRLKQRINTNGTSPTRERKRKVEI